MTRRPEVRTLVVLLALLLAPAASAATRSASEPTPDTPHARLGMWMDSLQEFLASHPDLTPEQVGAVLDAQRVAEPRLFAERLEPADAKLLSAPIESLRSSLSCAAFADLDAGFGTLRPWLQANVVIAPADPPCNCGGADDCDTGWTCTSIDCKSPAGTTHWGVCKKNTAAEEPAEPR